MNGSFEPFAAFQHSAAQPPMSARKGKPKEGKKMERAKRFLDRNRDDLYFDEPRERKLMAAIEAAIEGKEDEVILRLAEVIAIGIVLGGPLSGISHTEYVYGDGDFEGEQVVVKVSHENETYEERVQI